MTESKSIDRVFSSFQPKIYKDDGENTGALAWPNFNLETNGLMEGSKLINSNFFFTKMESFFPIKSENGVDSQFNPKFHTNNNMFDITYNEEEHHAAPSERIFSQSQKIPETSVSNNIGHNNYTNALSLGDTVKFRINDYISEKNSNIMPLQIQPNYFPFVIEYRKPLPPSTLEEEPIYVNAKQYERIMKLRIKRAKAGIIRGQNPAVTKSRNKNVKHESRSNHARKRRRDVNGRFSTQEESAHIDEEHPNLANLQAEPELKNAKKVSSKNLLLQKS